MLICVEATAEARIRADIGSASDSFTFQSATSRYPLPGVAMAALHRFVADATTSGAPTAWSIGTIPFAGDERDASWIRYEAAVMSVFAGVALRAVCLYDAATTPTAIREGVDRTHQRCDGHWITAAPVGPNADAQTQLTPMRAPDLLLHDPTPRRARATLQQHFADQLAPGQLEDLQLAASELITNAIVHGAPPVIVQAWRQRTGCVLQVSDAGSKTIDQYADFRPLAAGRHGGYGLWTIGQIAHSVDIAQAPAGNQVTIVLPTS